MEQVDKQEGRDVSAVPIDDPEYDTAVPRQREPSAAEIYLEVQRSPAFQEVRRRYRRFVFPAALAFLLWYLAYVVAATAAPGLMARPVAGAVNVAMVAGLGQFFTTFLLTWAYARHARLRRDRAALELRWDTQEMTRGVAQR
ncbi:Putative membrane protein [Streptomyces venezuelae]